MIRRASMLGPRSASQNGFTLIEVLVSLGLFSVGVIGFIALQASASNLTESADNVTRAALLANEVVAKMQAAGTVNVSVSDIDDLANGSSPSNLDLPGGAVTSTLDASGTTAKILVTWNEPQRLNADHTRITSRYETVYALP